MELSPTEYSLWALSTLLKGVLCALVVWRGVYLRLPLFSAYVAVALLGGLLRWAVYWQAGYDSQTAWSVAWITQAVVFLARSLAVVELCWQSLRSYQGLWALTWRLLLGVALLLTIHAAVAARGDEHWVVPFVLTLERGLELTAAVVLLLLLMVSTYYGIHLEPVQRMLALGLCVYSAVQVLNDTLMRGWILQHLPWWNTIRMLAFVVVLVMWCSALRRPLPALASPPKLLSEGTYETLMVEVNFRLRSLNRRLLEILKP